MMILRSAAPSPFGRKVQIALSLLGFDDDVKVEPTDTMDRGTARCVSRIRSARFRS